MKAASAIFLLPLLSMSTPARAEWRWLHPAVQGNSLRDVEFLDASTALAVGDAGTILVSHDTGLTWSLSFHTNGVSTALRKVARIDAAMAVVVGDGGVILKTLDAGTSWQTIASGTTASLEDVDFAGLVGVAIGGVATLRSTDGGQTWTPVTTLAMYGVDMVTASVGYAFSGFSVHKTIDGGQTWPTLPTPFGGPSGIVSFADAMNGVLTTGMSSIYIAHDGGATWTQRVLETGWSETSSGAADLEFLLPQTILASAITGSCDVYTGQCSSDGDFSRSTNDGVHWDYDNASRNLNGVAVSDAGVVLVVGDTGVVHRWVAPGTLSVLMPHSCGSDQRPLTNPR